MVKDMYKNFFWFPEKSPINEVMKQYDGYIISEFIKWGSALLVILVLAEEPDIEDEKYVYEKL